MLYKALIPFGTGSKGALWLYLLESWMVYSRLLYTIHDSIIPQIPKRLRYFPLFHHGCALNDRGAFFKKIFEYVFDELFAEITGSIAGEFVGQVSVSHHVHGTWHVGSRFLPRYFIHSINRIFQSRFPEVEGTGAVFVVRKVGNGMNIDICRLKV